MKSTLLSRKVQLLVVAFLLGLIGLFIVRNWDEFKSLSIENPWFILGIVVAVLINLASVGMQMESVLKPLGIKIKFYEVFGLAALTRFGNYIAPFKLGFTIRAYYLKSKHSLPISHFLATMTAAHVILYIISSIFGLISVLWLRSNGVEIDSLLIWITIGLGAILMTILFIRPKFNKKSSKVTRFLSNLLEGWSNISKDTSTLIQSSFYSGASILSFALMTYFEFKVFGVNLTPAETLFITSIMMLNTLVGITPAGLGVSEGLLVLAARAIGIPIPVAIATAILRRLIVFSVTGILSMSYSKRLLGVNILQLRMRTEGGLNED